MHPPVVAIVTLHEFWHRPPPRLDRVLKSKAKGGDLHCNHSTGGLSTKVSVAISSVSRSASLWVAPTEY